MTRDEYKAKLNGLHPQMDCDLEWKYTQEYITSLEARVAELEAMHDHQHLLNLADEAVAAKKRIAELEKLAVVWHKYPDEKPTKARMYAIAYRKNGETIYGYSIWHTTTSSWHKNTNDLDIVAWWKFPKLSSELTRPAPPEEQ